jgi:hypothetical protein
MNFPGLPKWPAIVVVGENVTLEQASEIIIRTNGGLWFSCNDHEWEKMLYEALNVKLTGDYPRPDYADLELAQGVYSVLEEVEYLSNDRIASCYVGGPNGWCDWDGTIGVNDKNIGKWPSCEDVFEEWKTIARAFPFLNLQCQLFDKEHCEDNPQVLIQFDVADANVVPSIPEKAFEIGWFNIDAATFNSPHRERGCTIEQFKEALDRI